MERKKKVEDVREGSVRWKKIGGGTFRMASGRIIKPQQIFVAHPDDIPKAHRDTVVPLSPLEEKPEEKLVPASGGYEIVVKSAGWYNVVDGNGKVMNEKGLRQEAAKELLESLT